VTEYRRRVLVAVGWTALQKWTLRVAGLLTFIALARLLTAEQIGLVALATAVTGIVGVLADLGISTYLVQAPQVDRRASSTAFWLSLGLSTVGTVIVLLLAGPLASLLGDPRLAPVMRVLSVNLVITGLTSTPVALLVRDLEFKLLAKREIISGLISAVIGVGLAVDGAGVWALVAQNVSQSVIALALIWGYTPWRPIAAFSRTTAVAVIRFGGPLLIAQLVQAVRDRLEQFLLGTLAGVGTLGYWTVATRVLDVLTQVTVSILDMVALPVFARARDHVDRFARTFETATTLSVAMLGPAVAVLAVVSPVLIPAVFGPDWRPAVVPAQILSGAYAIGSVAYFNQTAFVSQGKVVTQLVLTVVGFCSHLLVVLVAAPHGLVPLAIGMVIEAGFVVGLGAVTLRWRLSVGPWIYRRGALVLLACAGMLTAMWATVNASSTLPTVASTATAVAVGVLCYLALLMALCRSVASEAWGDVRRLVRR
jgi:O-antigen/teichoic acid export membrane protein